MEEIASFNEQYRGGKTMKKTLVLLLSSMMVIAFALASCGGGDTDLSDS